MQAYRPDHSLPLLTCLSMTPSAALLVPSGRIDYLGNSVQTEASAIVGQNEMVGGSLEVENRIGLGNGLILPEFENIDDDKVFKKAPIRP